MLFSSIPFLYYFLPCVILLYLIAPRFLKNTVLLLSSLVFYAWGEPRYVIWMILSISLGYIFGLLIERFREKRGIAKLFMILSVISSLAVLGYFKYADFFISNINAVTGCRNADIIVGPIGIVIADALLGEITPAMAAAVCQSSATRVLIPVNHCENYIVGVPDQPIGNLVAAAVQKVKALCAGEGC